MTVCNGPVNVIGCIAQVNNSSNTWIHCEYCVCMQKFNTACPEPLSLAICLVKKGLDNDIKTKCYSKIPIIVWILLPLFFLMFLVFVLVWCNKRYSLSQSKLYGSELQTGLHEGSRL